MGITTEGFAGVSGLGLTLAQWENWSREDRSIQDEGTGVGGQR